MAAIKSQLSLLKICSEDLSIEVLESSQFVCGPNLRFDTFKPWTSPYLTLKDLIYSPKRQIACI